MINKVNQYEDVRQLKLRSAAAASQCGSSFGDVLKSRIGSKDELQFSRHDVKVIVDMLMGMETPEEEFELNELNISAICEVMAKGEQGVYLALSPDVMQSVVSQLGDQIKKFSDLDQKPVILTSQVVRLYFYRLIEQFYPNVYVLSFNEIANNIQIQAVGNITI